MRDIDAFTAVHRFGLGPSPSGVGALAGDARGWLHEQTRRAPKPSAPMARFPDSAATLAAIHAARREGPEALKRTIGTLYRKRFAREVVARAQWMIETDAPFAERMMAFWSNHFTVSTSRRLIGPAIPAFEREAIRPHVFGRFTDMLGAVVQHPVMLSYLDNVGSMGINSRAGQRRARRRGNRSTLNENLAREILELHTLGVNGGYGQDDVIELANAISGWSHGGVRAKRDDRPVHGGFEFRPDYHEPGTRRILGRVYGEDGIAQGQAVLNDLARHPSTARFLATKLVRHFVADDPPPAAIEAIARVFRRTDGDLAEVARAVVELDAAWQDPLSKAKSHYELLIAVHRATGASRPRAAQVIKPLREFGQVPFTAPSPQGWGDTIGDWVAPESLMRRIQWLRQHTATLPPTLRPDMLLDTLLGPLVTDETRTWVNRAPSADAGIAMLLSSPEFQRR